jgi:hypothetical protein
MVSVAGILQDNQDGWILYYKPQCPHCGKLKDGLGRAKWALINKIDLSNVKNYRPRVINTVPTWMSVHTGETSKGYGRYR